MDVNRQNNGVAILRCSERVVVIRGPRPFFAE